MASTGRGLLLASFSLGTAALLGFGSGCVLVDNADYVGGSGSESETGDGDGDGDTGDGDTGDGDGDGDTGDGDGDTGDGDGDTGDGDGDMGDGDGDEGNVAELWCEDLDQDGVGGEANCVDVFPGDEPPEGYVLGSGDCVDTDENVYPGAAESEPQLCTLDADDDGWGDIGASALYPEADDGGDCDDADPGVVVCAEVGMACVDAVEGLADLLVQGVGGDGNYSYAWTPADVLDDPMAADPQAMVLNDTNFDVEVSDGLGNLASASVSVSSGLDWPLDAPGCETFGLVGVPAGQQLDLAGTTVCTVDDADPTAYVCPTVYAETQISTTFLVDTADDADIIGLVWGWQSADQFYLLSWKQATQGWYNCAGQAGITVKRVDRQEPYAIEDFACETDSANVSVLLGPSETTNEGWIDLHTYAVELLYEADQTTITITDTVDMIEVVSFIVADGSYPSGQAGSYSFSQTAACVGPWQSSCL